MDGQKSKPLKVSYSAEPVTEPISSSDVKVTNNYRKPDIILFKNIEKNATYTIYKDAQKQTQLKQFKATSTTETIKINQLTAKKGSIYVTVSKTNSAESVVTKVDYKAEKLPKLLAKNITVTNYHNANDKITLKGLTKGHTYTIFKDVNLNEKLISFKATGTTKKLSIKQLGSKPGAIYVVASKKDYQSSSATKVTFSKEKLVSLSAKNIKVTNNNSKDKIAFKGLTKGNTYTIYSDAKLKQKLTSFKATATTKTVTVKQVGAKAGSIYVVVSKSPYLKSDPTKVSFKSERTPKLSSKNVEVINLKKQDTIKLTGLKKGTKYVIYKDAGKKKIIASFKATSKTKTIKVKQLGKDAGKIYITAQKPGLRVSLLTKVDFPKEISGEKIAYLTFDDGPSSNTIKILDTLKKYDIKATFFVNGRTDDKSKKIYKRIVEEGHTIGNHTYSHDYSYIYSGKAAFMKDFNKLQNYIKDLTGVKMTVLRFPGGSNNTVSYKYGGKGLMKQLTADMKNKGYVYFDWNVDSTDASVAKQSKSNIVRSVLNGCKGKKEAVILMHDSAPKTTSAEALPEIIEGLKKQGFQFDRISTDTYAPQFTK